MRRLKVINHEAAREFDGQVFTILSFSALLQTLRPRHQAYIESFDSDNVAKRRKLHQEVLRGVLLCREFGDEKLQLASQMQELVSGDDCLLLVLHV